ATALRSSREALLLDFRIAGEPPWKGLRAACLVVSRMARETGGLVWDESTREVFTPEAWDRERLATWSEELPDVARHITIDAYKTDGGVRAVTLGMAKLGLPDVAVEGFGWSLSRPMGDLINSFAQALAEGATIGPGGRFTLRLRDLHNREARESQ